MTTAHPPKGHLAADGHEYMPPGTGFLGDISTPFDEQTARAVVIPFGLEATVSYGGGTAAGPAAMIAASHEVETFDEWFMRETVNDFGIATRMPKPVPAAVSDALEVLAAEVESVLAAGRLPVVFGGEHSITPGAIRPAVERYERLVLLHFDAHADLRDGYEGEPFSHAAAIRRCLDFPGVTVISFGIRNISKEEVEWLASGGSNRVTIAWAKDKRRWDLDSLLAGLDGADVWITFDVDGLDASLMPATGTPEPGGLFWDDVMEILHAASSRWGRVVGVDVNELAPLSGWHASDFVAARLAYRLTSFALCEEPRRNA